MNNEIEFNDYAFPGLGCFLSVRSDRVQMFYKVRRFGLQTPDEILTIDINAFSEEDADRLASEQGEILSKQHLYQRLEVLEEKINKAYGEGVISENNET